MSEMTLKTCPFCGCSPVEGCTYVDIGAGDCQKVFSVECKNLSCDVSPSIYVRGERGYRHTDDLDDYEAAKLASDSWNTREI